MTVTVGTDVYASVADANAYCTKYGKAAWTGADSVKELALLQATLYLDSYFQWVGLIDDTDQPLGWPRIDAYDAEGRLLEGIPTKVANACIELAVLALGGSLATMELPTTSGRVKRERLGEADIEYDFSAAAARPTYDLIVMLLRGIGSFGSNENAVKVRRC